MDVQSWLLTVFLISLRLTAALMITPLMNALNIPASVRVLLVVAMASGLALSFPEAACTGPLTMGLLLQGMLQEAALGALLGLSVMLAFAAASMAGAILDVQIGYGIAPVFDPLTRRRLPILTSSFGLMAVMVFFLVNGHHALIRALAYGLQRFPPGRPWDLAWSAGYLFKQASGMLGLGFSLAAPVIFCILLVEAALSVIARNLPQMNMFAMGIPVKVGVGIAAIALWMPFAGEAMGRIYQAIFTTWEGMLGGTS